MEKMVKVYNPHTEECSVTYQKHSYVVPAGGTIEVPEEVAAFWVTYIHQFLIVGDQEVKTEPVEIKEEKVVKTKK